MVGYINEGEKMDRYVDVPKFHVTVEVVKSSCSSFEECDLIALDVDSAICEAKKSLGGFYGNMISDKKGPTPMEISNHRDCLLLMSKSEDK